MNIKSCNNVGADNEVLQYDFEIETDTIKYRASIWYSLKKGKFIDWDISNENDGSEVTAAESLAIIEYIDKNWGNLTQ